MKTLAKYTYEYEAQLVQGALKEAGIESQIKNDSSMYPGLDFSEIQLQVNDEDFDKALDMINNMEFETVSDEELEQLALSSEDDLVDKEDCL